MSQQDKPDAKRILRLHIPTEGTVQFMCFGTPTISPPRDEPPGSALVRTDHHVCHHCDSKMVYATNIEKVAAERWVVDLRCPNCDRRFMAVNFGTTSTESFEEAFDAGTKAFARDFRRAAHARMEAELEILLAAFDADAVFPLDFGWPKR